MTSEEPQNDEPWRKMSLEELEKEYSPSKWSHRYTPDKIISAHVTSATERTEAARKNVPNRLNIPYSSKSKTLLDVFGEDLPKDSSIMVYVHGGYWQDLNKDLSSYVVEPLYKNGLVTVIVGYELAPQASVAEIVEQIKDALAWTCNFAKERGSRGVFLSGHSAGGQLIMHVLSKVLSQSTEDEKTLSTIKSLIRGAVPISGVFDMRPLVTTYVNEPLKLTESSAWSLSPMAYIRDLANELPNIRLLVAVGDHDSPEFQRQSREYCKRCKEAGLRSEYFVVDSADHFNIVEDLALVEFSLTKKILEFIKSFE